MHYLRIRPSFGGAIGGCIMDDIGPFFGHLLWNLWTVVAGIMISVEPTVRVFWHGYDDWAAKWLSAPRRKKLSRIGALVAFVLANFLAFHDVSEELRTATQRISEQNITASPYHWQMLNSGEAVALRAELRDLIPQPIAILCAEDDCGDLARSIRDVFRDLHWTPSCCAWSWGGIDNGIQIWSANEFLKDDMAGKIERATKGRLKIQVSQRVMLNSDKFKIQIAIGSKP
jgi:hypothetical protein